MAPIRLDGGHAVKSGETRDDVGGEPPLFGRQPF